MALQASRSLIPTEDYPRIIEMLKALEVGDVRKLDCHIAEIESPLPVLKCLEDTDVNVDELDYLAKRLDSFSDHELHEGNIRDLPRYLHPPRPRAHDLG